MTKSAQRFMDAIRQSWDHIDPWQQTAYLGFSEEDQKALLTICQEEQDADVCQTIEDVKEAIREHVRSVEAK